MIKAIFPEGVTAMTVNGLHQWDYGQQLQIQASGLPALVEVHFACDGMKEAVVRSCSVTSGTLTAAIPDICLEQTSPVMAWVYIVGGSSGITTLTVTLPVIARARPQPNATIPTATSDKYTEAVAAMNTAVANVAAGNVTIARAVADENGKNIADTYATKSAINGGTHLHTDIMTWAEEFLMANGNCIKQFVIAGGDYEKDANGDPVNLPHKMCIYCHGTLINYWGHATLYLWGANGQPNYYKLRDNSTKKWSDWKVLIDSGNFDEYAAQLTSQSIWRKTVSTGENAISSGLELNTRYLISVEQSNEHNSNKNVHAGVVLTVDAGDGTEYTSMVGEYRVVISRGLGVEADKIVEKWYIRLTYHDRTDFAAADAPVVTIRKAGAL